MIFTFKKYVQPMTFGSQTQVGHYANQIIVSDIKIYVRTIRKGSLFYSFKAENLLARIEVGYKVNAFLKKENKLEYYAETWGYFL